MNSFSPESVANASKKALREMYEEETAETGEKFTLTLAMRLRRFARQLWKRA